MAVKESSSKDISFLHGFSGEERSFTSDRKNWSQAMRSSREARAKRLKLLRNMTSLSRRAFYKHYGIPMGTLQNWESARFGGLSEKGAYIVLQALRAEGISCSFEWLMYGQGEAPKISRMKFGTGRKNQSNEKGEIEPAFMVSEDKDVLEQALETISEELLAFRKLNHNPVDCVVRDDGMLPRFIQGEYVAGSRLYDSDISNLIGKDCIVKTKLGDTLVRRLRRGTCPDLYLLVCTNANTTVNRPALYDVELLYAAPIVWARRMGDI